ncbi:hypothetical protein XENORESO_003226 [Xenotaenia resolanae]|uniref:Uncharacterized protein n=1 Tax=Xenotaenia resolanae TaxID=208358 RepID=A0ABV0VLR1_9TELE
MNIKTTSSCLYCNISVVSNISSTLNPQLITQCNAQIKTQPCCWLQTSHECRRANGAECRSCSCKSEADKKCVFSLDKNLVLNQVIYIHTHSDKYTNGWALVSSECSLFKLTTYLTAHSYGKN